MPFAHTQTERRLRINGVMNTRTPIFPNSNPRPVRVLVAEDDERSRTGLVRLLERDGYEVSVADDGQAAIDILLAPDPPQIALIDWGMPRLDGIHVCMAVRSMPTNPYTYIIMVTAKAQAADALAAFAAGVDDFLSKPIDSLQLLARLRCGERVLSLEKRCAERVADLKGALDEVRKLQSLLPICKYCKRVRDDADCWHVFEGYLRDEPGSDFSKVVCPDCMESAAGR
jgi:CheY-like chemotaxis protein